MLRKLQFCWAWAWMQFSGLSWFGRLACCLASWGAPPWKARQSLALMGRHGYISPSATIYHSKVRLGMKCFIGDDVILYQAPGGGAIELGDRVCLVGRAVLETGEGGSIAIGSHSRVHDGCRLMAYKTAIQIGKDVGIASDCSFYPHNHGTNLGAPISSQALESQGPIIIEDEVWLGVGVVVLTGVRIGRGAIIGAGAVVTHDIPEGAIAAGVPARVIRMRSAINESVTKMARSSAGERSHVLR